MNEDSEVGWRLLAQAAVNTLDQGIVQPFGAYQAKFHFPRQAAKERDAAPKQDGNPGDDHLVDEIRFKETLDGTSAIHVEVVKSSRA